MVQTTLKKLQVDPLPRALLVHGPEMVWHDQIYTILKRRNAADSLADWNWSVFHGNKDFDLDPFLAELGMLPWGGVEKIMVLKNAHALPAASLEEIAAFLEKNPEANHLALFMEKVDKRLKFLKTLKPFVWEIECLPLQGESLIRYVADYCTEQGKIMKRATVELFLDRVGTNLLLIEQELAKLFAYCNEEEEITREVVQKISSLTPGQIQNHTIFQMTDFIVQKNRKAALDTLDLLLGAGEPALRILPLIERQFRLVLAAKTSTTTPEQTAKQMGENNAYPLKKMLPYANKFTLDEIFSGFSAILDADRELKFGTPGEQVLADLILKLT